MKVHIMLKRLDNFHPLTYKNDKKPEAEPKTWHLYTTLVYQGWDIYKTTLDIKSMDFA